MAKLNQNKYINSNIDSKLQCPISLGALKSPASPIFKFDGAYFSKTRTINYLEADQIVSDIQNCLEHLTVEKALGVGKQLKLAFIPELDPRYALLFFACLRAKIVAVPLSPHFPSHQLDEMLADVLPDLTLGFFFSGARKIELDEIFPMDTFRSSHQEPFARGTPLYDVDQIANVIFTSGSTGRPKPVAHTYGNHYYSALGSSEILPLAKENEWLLALPLFHIGGLAILHRAFQAIACVGFYLSTSTTHLSWVSTQLSRCIKENPGQIIDKHILLGGGNVDRSLVQEALKNKARIYTSYGMTEMSSQIHTICWELKNQQLVNKEKLLTYRRLKISRTQEILVAGEVLSPGYFQEGVFHKHRLDSDGFLSTKDLGDLNEWRLSKKLIVTGRKDHLFVCGGENIQPEFIELSLLKYHGLKKAFVFPEKSDDLGAVPVAMLEFEDQTDMIGLRKHVAYALRGYFKPVKYYAWETALTDDVKLNRSKLAERLDQIRKKEL